MMGFFKEQKLFNKNLTDRVNDLEDKTDFVTCYATGCLVDRKKAKEVSYYGEMISGREVVYYSKDQAPEYDVVVLNRTKGGGTYMGFKLEQGDNYFKVIPEQQVPCTEKGRITKRLF